MIGNVDNNRMTKRNRILLRFNRWAQYRLLRPIGWLFWHTSIRHESHKTIFMSGLHEAFWCYLCDGDLKYALHIGNIWWCVRWLP